LPREGFWFRDDFGGDTLSTSSAASIVVLRSCEILQRTQHQDVSAKLTYFQMLLDHATRPLPETVKATNQPQNTTIVADTFQKHDCFAGKSGTNVYRLMLDKLT